MLVHTICDDGVYKWVWKNCLLRCWETIEKLKWYRITEIRSSCSQMFFKIGVCKNFAIFTEIHLRWSLFLIQRLQLVCFSVNTAKFLRTVFSIKHLRRLHFKVVLVTPLNYFWLQKSLVEKIIPTIWNDSKNLMKVSKGYLQRDEKTLLGLGWKGWIWRADFEK